MSTFCKGHKEDSVVGKAKQINAKMEQYFFLPIRLLIYRVGNSFIGFLSKLLIFVRERAIRYSEKELIACPRLSRVTIFSQLLFFQEQQER